MGVTTPLRRAARFLTPVSVQLPAGQARRLSFLCEAGTHRRELRVTLSPIAGPPCAGEWAVVDFRLDGQDLSVAGPVLEHRDRAAIVLVRRPLTVRPPRRGRVVPAPGSLVAVFVPEGTGLGRCCQPVLDIGLRALRVASSHPFAPGVVLRDLTVLAGAEVVRQAEGTVVGSAPVLLVDGSTSHHCTVRLRGLATLPPSDDPADLVEISEPTRVRTILWALGDLAHRVTLRFGAETVEGQLAAVRGNRDELPEMRCTLTREVRVVGPVQAECTLYGSGYRFYCRVNGSDGRTLHLAPAPVVREWHRRQEERVVLPAGVSGKVSFRHPLDGGRYERPLVDVSVRGFGFDGQAGQDALWPGLPLRDVAVEVAGLTVRPAHATVRTVSEPRCGVQMEHLSDRDADRLRFELMKASAHPIEFHDGEDFDAILDLHRSTRLLEADMARNLDHTLDETRRTWRLAHQHPDGLMRTAMVRWKGRIGATATLVRAYEQGWALQHLTVASPAVPSTLGSVQSALVRLALARSDCEYVFGLVDEEAQSVHTVLDAFLARWSTPEHRGASRLVLYAGGARPPAKAGPGVRRLRANEEKIIENAALRLLHPVCAFSLGLRAGQIRLRGVAADWREVGLDRGREPWAAFKRGRLVGILLREWASPGLSLSSLLSASLYLPVHSDLDADTARSLLELGLQHDVPGRPPVRFVLTPEPHDSTLFEAVGLHRVAGCTLYAFHGIGLQEYQRYMATRYGFLYGHLRARTRPTT